MPNLYIIDDDDSVIAIYDHAAWIKWMAVHNPRVAFTELLDAGCEVSTVFLGRSDWPSTGHAPMVYETMVFGGNLDGLTIQYASRAEAIDGHLKAIEAVKELAAILAATGETFMATVE